jgi:hypothetical protein
VKARKPKVDERAVMRAIVAMQEHLEVIVDQHFTSGTTYSGGATMLVVTHLAAAECAIICAHLRDDGASPEHVAAVRAEFLELFDAAFRFYDLGTQESSS